TLSVAHTARWSWMFRRRAQPATVRRVQALGGSPGGDRLVGDQPVTPRRNLLHESLGAAAHHHQTLLHVDHDATSCSCVKVRISAAPQDVRPSATPSTHLPAPAPSPIPLAAALASPGRLSLHPVMYSN